jgi:DNA-binding MarR family transcriptional regulator
MAAVDRSDLALWADLVTAVRSVRDELRDRLGQRDLPLPWFDALSALRAAGGRLRLQALADAVHLPKSTVSRQVDGMEEAGLVERELHEGDARAVVVALTTEGRAVWRSANGLEERLVARRFARHLRSGDAEALRRVVDAVAASQGKETSSQGT